ncbi:hypothetical protein J3Q64DRAFT_1827880 [Phycomyces blakesleeanus]|uniref:Uncharacterized protein n=2 Tax=Phycomyces blakesleeanus TaxID=4837 RepID=A0A162TEU3_PHYB8|nr:hypothetical protein PHYBLDRAFT_79356 [Phycomyces blakesleeanus NRRL 1555(-)]OAD68032.1 hypothetical protein PHYBLDRAFT_79356 [Phycomyces blakesleeanus NRRL 1555(-)]|eukprot:XP_018286072.1 hypothetical protein PHYBLDRAFT_79356 [Phycomyces blakesleeanus NRRL 1555(-)]
MLTLALGYISVPVAIEASVRSNVTPANPFPWTLGNTLSIACFVSKPPTSYPTVAKHILGIPPDATRADQELFSLISSSLNAQSQQRLWAMIILQDGLVGVLSSSNASKLVLQIVEPTACLPYPLPSFSPQAANFGPKLSQEQLMGYPVYIQQLCQQWPDPAASASLHAVAQEVYQIALLYGYWNLWRVVVGICERFGIDPQKLIA